MQGTCTHNCLRWEGIRFRNNKYRSNLKKNGRNLFHWLRFKQAISFIFALPFMAGPWSWEKLVIDTNEGREQQREAG